MSSIKWELEDLSFFYLEPDAYQRIARMVAESREVRERYLAETIKTLTDELNRIGLEGFQINGRSKHYWSIYQKDEAQGQGNSPRSTTWWHCVSSRIRCAIATPRSARCTRCGTPCPAASKTTSPCRSSTCTSRCTRRSSAPRPVRSRFRFEPTRCMSRPSTALPPTGYIRSRADRLLPRPMTLNVWTTRSTGSSIRSIGRLPTRSPTPRNTCIR